MEKIDFKRLNIETVLGDNDFNSVFLLSDGSVLKLFKHDILIQSLRLEQKILTSKPIFNVPEIVVPNRAVYLSDKFVGYTMDRVDGIDYNTRDNRYSLSDRADLNMYATIYSKLEDVVKRANKEGMIFPDLCTCDNIFIDKNGNYKLIDYDGIQIGNFITPFLSTSLGDDLQYEIPKYSKKTHLFTSELDKKSLIILYFLSTFNVNLETININKNITLDYIFNCINLKDDDIKHKVWKCYQPNLANEFLGDSVFKLAEEKDMLIKPCGPAYIKRLVKKK